MIFVGRRPRLVVAPIEAERLGPRRSPIPLTSRAGAIAAALKLALASFPEGPRQANRPHQRRQREPRQRRGAGATAKQNGVQIDVVPLAAGWRKENEVLVESIEAPPVAEKGVRLPIRVLLRSHNPNPVVGELTLRQIVEGVGRPVAPPGKVRLEPGLSTFEFDQPLCAAKGESYTYEAEFVPAGVLVTGEKALKPLAGRPAGEQHGDHARHRPRPPPRPAPRSGRPASTPTSSARCAAQGST